jgi:hypothetical protein
VLALNIEFSGLRIGELCCQDHAQLEREHAKGGRDMTALPLNSSLKCASVGLDYKQICQASVAAARVKSRLLRCYRIEGVEKQQPGDEPADMGLPRDLLTGLLAKRKRT